MFRSKYGGSSVFDNMASSDHENNSPVGDLLPSFNTNFYNVRIALCPVIYDRILASIRNVITSYNYYLAHGLFVLDSFHPLAVLNSIILLPSGIERIILLIFCIICYLVL